MKAFYYLTFLCLMLGDIDDRIGDSREYKTRRTSGLNSWNREWHFSKASARVSSSFSAISFICILNSVLIFTKQINRILNNHWKTCYLKYEFFSHRFKMFGRFFKNILLNCSMFFSEKGLKLKQMTQALTVQFQVRSGHFDTLLSKPIC